MNLNKIAKILTVVIAVIGIGLLMRVFMHDEEAFADTDLQASVIDPLISFSLWILYLTIAVTLVLSLGALFKNPAALKKALMGIGVLGVLLLVAYFMADNSENVLDAAGDVLKDGGAAGSSISKWVSTGIWYSMFLGIIGGGLFVWDLGKGIIKS